MLRRESWASAMDVHRAREYVLEVSRLQLFRDLIAFIRPLQELVCLTSACVYQRPCRCLFQHLTKRSTQQEMQQALAELEAIRLGWPEAAYSLPGRTTTPWGESSWLILPIDLFPNRARELRELQLSCRAEGTLVSHRPQPRMLGRPMGCARR